MNPRAIINLNNLIDNLNYLSSKMSSGNIMPVIKANAYGHGSVYIAKYLSNKISTIFCVATLSEIAELVNNKINSPILHLGKLSNKNNQIIIEPNIRFTINSSDDIDTLSRIAKQHKKKIKCHIKVDSGMNRMGCHFNQFEQILNKLLNQQLLVVEGVYSHLSCSTDINNKNNSLQVEKFSEIVFTSCCDGYMR